MEVHTAFLSLLWPMMAGGAKPALEGGGVCHIQREIAYLYVEGFSSLRICFYTTSILNDIWLLSGSRGISLMTFHRFPFPLLRRALSMFSFMLSALPNGSPLSFPMISMGSLGRWRRASPRAAASARLCLSSSSSLAIATASRIWFEKVVGDSAASSLTVRPSWVRVKMLSP